MLWIEVCMTVHILNCLDCVCTLLVCDYADHWPVTSIVCALSTCLEQFRISLSMPDLNIQLSDHLTLLLFALATCLRTYTALAFILPASYRATVTLIIKKKGGKLVPQNLVGERRLKSGRIQ